METVGNGDGGNWPPDGDGLPDLPPGWGSVTIPDDASALAEEAAQVRAELRHSARRRHRPAPRRLPLRDATGRSTGKLPAVLLALAVMATLTGLFTLSYTGAQRGAQQRAEEAAGPAAARPSSVPALDLVGPDGQAVALRSRLPAVILLTDGCPCHDLIADTAAAAPAALSVLVVARVRPTVPDDLAGDDRVRALADPAGGLRSMLGLAPSSGRGTAVLVTGASQIVRVVPEAATADDFRADLAALGG